MNDISFYSSNLNMNDFDYQNSIADGSFNDVSLYINKKDK